MMEDVPVNGKILKEAREKIKLALVPKPKRKLTEEHRTILEVMDLIVLFMAEDHPKVKEMHPIFIWGRWVGLAALGAFITACATGRVMISFVK